MGKEDRKRSIPECALLHTRKCLAYFADHSMQFHLEAHFFNGLKFSNTQVSFTHTCIVYLLVKSIFAFFILKALKMSFNAAAIFCILLIVCTCLLSFTEN